MWLNKIINKILFFIWKMSKLNYLLLQDIKGVKLRKKETKLIVSNDITNDLPVSYVWTLIHNSRMQYILMLMKFIEFKFNLYFFYSIYCQVSLSYLMDPWVKGGENKMFLFVFLSHLCFVTNSASGSGCK